MDQDQERFLNELLDDFRIEASEHYHAIIEGLLILENNSDATIQHSTVEKIFREVHSLKGAARAVNLPDIERLCGSVENVFNSLKKGEAKLSRSLFDTFHKVIDLLSLLLTDVNQHEKNRGNYNLVQVLKNLEFAHRNSVQPKDNYSSHENLSGGNSIQVIGEDPKPGKTDSLRPPGNLREHNLNLGGPKNIQGKENQTVRVSTDKLSHLLVQSEELVSIKTTFEYYLYELQTIHNSYSAWNRKSAVKKVLFKDSREYPIENDHLVSERNFRKKHEDDLGWLIREMAQFQRGTNKMVDELLHDIKTTLLFPFSSLLGIFPKLVRDLGKEYSKEIEVVIEGDTIEIDRRILEEMKDPLIHLIRNCIDHGIETAKERVKKGKPLKGKIEIRISQDIDQTIQLLIKDDGAGLDRDKIISSAIKLDVYKTTEVEKLSDREVYSLIFQSGISASPFITNISGRGLGMAIVAEKVLKLGGRIELESRKDSGTSFIISLPQTLATFRGVLIKSAEQYFIFPSSEVEVALRIRNGQIKTVGSGQTICYGNDTVGLVLLSDVLRITTGTKKRSSGEYLKVVILNVALKKIAFVVDEIMGEQEGTVKNLGPQLAHVKNIAGSTILGSGKVALILHPMELMDSATNAGSAVEYAAENGNSSEIEPEKYILVAEDSITIRTLLRNYIENAGFKVKTAVDGMEAYQLFQNESFDLIVSDVEMPRMNGFELTSKIREDKRHADVPIILVTALESADDKQRGMEVGANAYIIKSSFENNKLIESIQRLI